MKKKILIFNLMYYPNPISGAESAIKDITERISEDGIEFHMITGLWNSKIPKTEKIGHVLVHRIGFGIPDPTSTDFKTNRKLNLNKYLFQIISPFYALHLHRKYKYDAIWGMMAHSVGIACGIFKTFKPNVKYILSLQEGDPIEHIERVAKKGGFVSWFLFKRGFTLADKIQSISVYLADWARKMTDNKTEIIIVRDGANPNDMSGNFDQKIVDDLKIKLNKKTDDIYLVNTSRIEHQKGHDLTIKSLQFLPANYKYIIVGDGNKQEEYQKLADDLNLSDRVIFTGRVDRSVVTAYRKLCDIFVAPSRTEGQGHAFNSAMASRLPLVTTGAGGIKEYAFDNETAWLVPQEDPEAIAKKVIEIVNDKENTKRIVEKARKLMEEEYDWDKIAVIMKEKVFN
jgi:glycosyltransferase involved in cell wall biosynthesis